MGKKSLAKKVPKIAPENRPVTARNSEETHMRYSTVSD